MKIGIILVESLPLPPVKGGAVENLVQLIIDNNEIQKNGDFIIFSKYDVIAEQKSNDYSYTKYIYYNPGFIGRSVDFVLKVIRRLLRVLFNVRTPSLYEIKAYCVLKKAGVKTIVLENCPNYACFLNRKREFRLIQHLHNDYFHELNKQNLRIIHSTNKFITVSNFIKNRLRSISPLEISIETCYNGIDLGAFSKGIDTDKLNGLREDLGIQPNDKVLIFTGRLVRNKGVKELLLAFRSLTDKYENLKILIVGGVSFSNNNKDEYIAELESVSSTIKGKVIFTGYVDYSCIVQYLKLAAVAVVPSTCYEAFPLSTLEAMASGVPVIVSDAGGMLEQVTPQTGIVVQCGKNFVSDLATAIEELISDDSRLLEMSKAAKARAQYFSDKRMYDRFIELVK